LNCNSLMSASSGIFGVLPLHPLRIVHGWFVKLSCYLLVKHMQFVKLLDPLL
jgi:hypothetical protein